MPRMRCSPLIEENLVFLQQLASLLDRLRDSEYAPPEAGDQTIGRHVRHVLAHYHCLLAALHDPSHRTVPLDYEQRHRDRRPEQSVAVGREALASLQNRLRRLGASTLPEHLTVAYPCDADLDPATDAAADPLNLPLPSSPERELAFLSSHTVHHLALIGHLATLSDVEVPASFGVHPSTLRHQRRVQTTPTDAPAARGTGPIDVCALLAEKNPALYQRLPRWAMPLLRWVVNERALNTGLQQFRHTPCRAFPGAVRVHLGVSAQTRPMSRPLPAPKSRPVFVANHPTGGFDGVLMLDWLLQHYDEVRVVVTDALMSIPQMRPFLVPVDRYRRSRWSTLNLKSAFAGDAALLVFPAGRTGRTQDRRVEEFPWQRMPVTLAREYGRTLVPVHIEGHHSRRFNLTAALRRRLGLALNLEMLWLSRDFLNPSCRQYSLTAGSPIDPATLLEAGATDSERLHWLRRRYDSLAADTRTKPHQHGNAQQEVTP
ncbi:hypothetical protein E4656_11665 [Natronospirillum operosum]|uniref:Phospholipid/glycerol acyltransferase domain-containing protein n=1 Tax=Natronospirillum operosum TaxID=2759953 RepID=A0A4Z0WAN4_9GAMM|nr:1-acyl-sn-glycerol-3-phosphate acyltransferase [Natronospirillum operosum]TGG92781.1 hypothetical protein E4656_11665 [Natronospirillum operosum]